MKKSLIVISIIIIILFSYSVGFANNFDKVDTVGYRILTNIRKIGFWIIVFKAIQDFIKCALNGDIQAIGGIFMKYVLLYGAMFAIVTTLTWVEGIFS